MCPKMCLCPNMCPEMYPVTKNVFVTKKVSKMYPYVQITEFFFADYYCRNEYCSSSQNRIRFRVLPVLMGVLLEIDISTVVSRFVIE